MGDEIAGMNYKWTLKDAIEAAISHSNREKTGVIVVVHEDTYLIQMATEPIDKGDMWVAMAKPGKLISTEKNKKPTPWTTTRWMDLSNKEKQRH